MTHNFSTSSPSDGEIYSHFTPSEGDIDSSTIDSFLSFPSISEIRDKNEKKITNSYHMTNSMLSLIIEESCLFVLYALPSKINDPLRKLLELELKLFNDNPSSSLETDDYGLTSTLSDMNIVMHSILDHSNILGIVCRSWNKDTLFLYDYKLNQKLATSEFSESYGRIFDIYLHMDFVVVQFERHFTIFDNSLISTFHHSVNPLTKLQVLPSALVFAQGNEISWIKNFSENLKESIPAHNSEVLACCMDQKQRLLASASKKGTLVKIFDVESKKNILTLRRGQWKAHIYCISFSCSSKYVAASSSNGTLHIWDLTPKSKSWFFERAALTVKALDVPNACHFDSKNDNIIHVYAPETSKYYLIEVCSSEAIIRSEMTLFAPKVSQ